MSDHHDSAPRAGTPSLVPGAGRWVTPAAHPGQATLPGSSPGPAPFHPTPARSAPREAWLAAVRARGVLLPVPLRWMSGDRAVEVAVHGRPMPRSSLAIPAACASAVLGALALRGADARHLALRDLVACLRGWALDRQGGVTDPHDPTAPPLHVVELRRLAGLPMIVTDAPLVRPAGHLATRLAALAMLHPHLARRLPAGGDVLTLWQLLRALPCTASRGDAAFVLGLPAGE